MSRTSSRGRLGFVGAVIVGSLAAGAVSCADGEGTDAAHDPSTGPMEFCGGNAISAEAGKALKVITGGVPVGEQALAAPDAGVVRFACRSGKLPGSAPAHIRLGVERWSSEDPEGDPEKLKDAYATVAHSFALAMAKELGCENDGGLEARPVLDPV